MSCGSLVQASNWWLQNKRGECRRRHMLYRVGTAEGMLSVVVVVCKDHKQAKIAEQGCEHRSESHFGMRSGSCSTKEVTRRGGLEREVASEFVLLPRGLQDKTR